ncbi:MAG: hypothetical protein KAT65_08035 [Methanophagales archaeon]|nr:hypothetical protein [Methanophagales archaeon]
MGLISPNCAYLLIFAPIRYARKVNNPLIKSNPIKFINAAIGFGSGIKRKRESNENKELIAVKVCLIPLI